MTKGISRRAALRGFGQSVAFGSLAGALSRYATAAEPAASQAAPPAAKPATTPTGSTICLVMLYPSGDGLKFDADRFRDHHLPLLKSTYSGALERVELRAPSPPPALADGAPPPPTPPLLAAVSIWIRDVSKFVAEANAHSKDISADIATVTNSAPMVQFDRVIGALGAGREAVAMKTDCISEYFPVKEGATWDAQGYIDGYLAKVYQVYGSTAIKRIEITKGAQGQGGKDPLFLGAAHLYIADDATFDMTSATDAAKQVAPEAAKYYSTPPFPAYMEVAAVG
ncbi:MAG TPA: hypothetical protein VMH77_00950 [Steroidobacteraceae bacterium]|nr:hypothetical protein [Steroidobacteraceae bacterium]